MNEIKHLALGSAVSFDLYSCATMTYRIVKWSIHKVFGKAKVGVKTHGQRGLQPIPAFTEVSFGTSDATRPEGGYEPPAGFTGGGSNLEPRAGFVSFCITPT